MSFATFRDRTRKPGYLIMVWRFKGITFLTPKGGAEILLRSGGRLWETCPLCGKPAAEHSAWPVDGPHYRAYCVKEYETIQERLKRLEGK